jgi:Ala-tRNA(Pro) deacylase
LTEITIVHSNENVPASSPGEAKLYSILESLNISYTRYEHGPAPTIEIAQQYWNNIPCTHCRNIFFRNHKGSRHYLVIVEQHSEFPVNKLEGYVREGKLSFASGWRLEKFLGVEAGAVSPFGLVHDEAHHVKVFLDPLLKSADRLSFHPLRNTASLVIERVDLLRFLDYLGNEVEWMDFLTAR